MSEIRTAEAKGEIEGKRKTVLKLKKLGVSIDVIVESTELSKDEIGKL